MPKPVLPSFIGDQLRAAFDYLIDGPLDSQNVTGASVVGSLRISVATTPASATAAGVAGTIAWDANYLYVCVATNTWKRVGIATWV